MILNINKQFPSIFSEKRQKLKDLSFRVTAGSCCWQHHEKQCTLLGASISCTSITFHKLQHVNFEEKWKNINLNVFIPK